MATMFSSVSGGNNAPAAAPNVFSGTNNPQTETFLNNLFGEFKLVASGLGEGVTKTTECANRLIAILYLINRSAGEAPGLAQSYAMQVAKEKGSIFGAKLFNFALSKIDPHVRQVIDGMFGQVKAQMCQALELLIADYKPEVNPTVEDVVGYITNTDNGGIKILAMRYMSIKQQEQHNARIEQERKDQLYWKDEQRIKDENAVACGYANYTEMQNALAAIQQAELMKSAKKKIAAKGTLIGPMAGLVDGSFYLAVDGRLYQVNEADESALIRCAASVL